MAHLCSGPIFLVLASGCWSIAAASRRPAVSFRGGARLDKWSSWLDVKTTRLKHVMPKVTSDPALGQALSLMKKRSLASVEKAVSLLRGAHLRDPDNLEVKLELADALNTVMRIKTNANALVIEGTLDTPGNKRVWKTLGEEALPLARW